MSWKAKLCIAFVIVFLLSGIFMLGYFVRARYQGNAYFVQVTAAFNAAALLNGEETYTDPERAVISSYGGARHVIVPENYKALVSLLRKENAMPLFRRVAGDAPLTIAICDSARLRIEPDQGSVDGALVAFEAGDGHRYTMHIRGGNIWTQLLEYATTGHGEWKNVDL